MPIWLESWFAAGDLLAVCISILLNIVIAVVGIIPSLFITAANITYFGFIDGTLISLIGEAAGALVAFYLYRKGLQRFSIKKLQEYPRVQPLFTLEGKQAFLLVLTLRLLPFMPSMIVTLAAALGRITPLLFILASTLGKIPAQFMEAYSVLHVTQWTWQGKSIITLAALALLIRIWQKEKAKQKS